jgi:glycosyltransferase involved in cell wall biosynthesis
VHIQTESAPTTAVIAAAAKKAGIGYVFAHSHGALGRRSKLYNKIKFGMSAGLINKNVDCRFACSKAAGIYTFGEKYPVTVQHNGIDTERFAYDPAKREEIRRQLNLEGKFVLGNIGRFNYQKNHQFLLEIFGELKKKSPDAVLLIAGGGELEADLRQKTRALNLTDDVIFYGWTDNPEDLYQAMDVFVLPSLFEGLPIVSVEAQCAGLPVVCSAAVTEEARLTDLFLRQDGSAEQWAQVILRQKDNISGRRSRREEIALAGYDARDSSQKLLTSYLTALGNSYSNEKELAGV